MKSAPRTRAARTDARIRTHTGAPSRVGESFLCVSLQRTTDNNGRLSARNFQRHFQRFSFECTGSRKDYDQKVKYIASVGNK